MSRRSYAARWRMGAGLLLGAILAAFALAAPHMIADVMGVHAGVGAALLATAAVATTRDLATILKEAKALQEKYVGKPMPEDEGKKFDDLMKEAKALQDSDDRERQLRLLDAKAREPVDPVLPRATGGGEPDEQKGRKESKGGRIAGYITAGQLVALSPALDQFVKSNARSGLVAVDVQSLHERLIPLSVEQRKQVETMLEQKAVPVIGAGVIEADRVEDWVRVAEQDETILRDVLNVSRTTAPTIAYTRITSVTRAAAIVAAGGVKPEAALSTDRATADVVTIAVHMPVQEQQLQDVPQIQNMIDVELRYDLRKVEEEKVMYGPGGAGDILGITNDPLVAAGTAVAGDTFLDRIRRAITDVRVSGHSPNAVVIHPRDWESIVLLKGTDNKYVWTIVTGPEGDRVWGLRVVETTAAEENAGNTTEERNIVVGDFRRGATLYDRMQAAVAVGWINNQFITNERTIRAEERIAFAIKRPLAFRTITTQVAVP